MKSFDIENPKEKKYFEKRSNLLNFPAILGLFVFAMLVKFGSELESSSKLIEVLYFAGMAISFFAFLAGLIMHPMYDIVSDEKIWKINEIKNKSPETKSYILKVGEQGRSLYNIELDMLYSFYHDKVLLEQKNNIYHKS